MTFLRQGKKTNRSVTLPLQHSKKAGQIHAFVVTSAEVTLTRSSFWKVTLRGSVRPRLSLCTILSLSNEV